jgi:hypothetical protein
LWQSSGIAQKTGKNGHGINHEPPGPFGETQDSSYLKGVSIICDRAGRGNERTFSGIIPREEKQLIQHFQPLVAKPVSPVFG